MHALATLTGAMGRCGKRSRACGQLIQQVGLETCAPIGNEDRATRRFKRCASSEPIVNVVRSRRKRDAANKETEDRLVNHYTINIYLNEAPKDRALYADTKSSQFAVSVDKLTKTIASNSPVIEGFLRNKDPDKDRDYIEEKLGTFWKHVFENSKLEHQSGVNEEKNSVALEKKKCETNLIKPKLENNEDKKEPFFLPENQNEKIYVNEEFKLETRREESDLPTHIPHYEKGFYDSRTVKPKKIISPNNQARRRLSQDVEEVNKHIKDLVELSTRSQTKESSLSKIITYCKSFLTKETKPKASTGEYPKGSLFPTGVLGGYCEGRRRYHQATCRYLETISDNKENKRILCPGSFLFHNGIVGGCYDGKRGYHRATLGYLETVSDIKRNYLSTQHNEAESKRILYRGSFLNKNLRNEFILKKPKASAKQSNKFALYNLILSLNNGPIKPSKPILPINKSMNLDKISRNKNKSNFGSEKILSKIKSKGYKFDGTEKKYKDREEPKSMCKKILRKRKRKLSMMKSENEKSLKLPQRIYGKTQHKTAPIYSATVSNTPSKKLEVKARVVSSKLKKPANVTRTFPTVQTIPFKDSLMKQIRTVNKKMIAMKYKTNSVFNEEISAVATQRHPGFRVHSRPLLANPKKQIGSFKRTICHDKSDKNKKQTTCQNICKKQKRHGKKECPPTSQKLAERDSDGPKEPLKYPDLYPRCDESLKSAIPQKDPVAEIKGLLDNSKKEEFDCYFGEGGYKNYEYYSYTRTSFYDVNNYMTPTRNPQPNSGARPK